jgi:hypothetical protein
VRNDLFALVVPVISLPMMVTCDTCPESTQDMNSLKVIDLSLGWNAPERFQTSMATTTSTNQKTKLRMVEFT